MLNMVIYFLELEQTTGALMTRGKVWSCLFIGYCCVMLRSNKLLFYVCSSVLQYCSGFRFSIIFDISFFVDVDYQLVLGCIELRALYVLKFNLPIMLNIIIYFLELDEAKEKLEKTRKGMILLAFFFLCVKWSPLQHNESIEFFFFFF